MASGVIDKFRMSGAGRIASEPKKTRRPEIRPTRRKANLKNQSDESIAGFSRTSQAIGTQ